MKVLFLSDNREHYGSGYYYQDWLEAFVGRFKTVYVFGPGFDTTIDEVPSDIDIVVYAHSFMELYLKQKWRRWFNNFFGLNIGKLRHIPSILFSKNEYKFMEERVHFARKLSHCLFIVYSKHSLDKYHKVYPNVFWVPFGINPNRFFRDESIAKVIDVGMRGNRHQSYIGGLRADLANRLQALPIKTDVKLSDNGEDFLFGERYRHWLNECKLVGNTVSALDIVNPKFAETIACGAIPICPPGDYEGLLYEGFHYWRVEEIEKHTKGEFDQFYQERYALLKPHFEKFRQVFSYDNLLNLSLLKFENKIDATSARECFIDYP